MEARGNGINKLELVVIDTCTVVQVRWPLAFGKFKLGKLHHSPTPTFSTLFLPARNLFSFLFLPIKD